MLARDAVAFSQVFRPVLGVRLNDARPYLLESARAVGSTRTYVALFCFVLHALSACSTHACRGVAGQVSLPTCVDPKEGVGVGGEREYIGRHGFLIR